MIQVTSRWEDKAAQGSFLVLGPFTAGQVFKTSIGTWVAYYGETSLRDFPDEGAAKAAVEAALWDATQRANL